jgi:hypothetical protein
MMSSLFRVITSFRFENVAWQSASHNCAIEMRDFAMFGNMCAILAVSGICGISNCAVCVDCIVALFGSITVMLGDAVVLLMHGLVVWRK